jgi:hypothetical protein
MVVVCWIFVTGNIKTLQNHEQGAIQPNYYGLESAMLLHCSELSVTPSGHCGEVGSFSSSLEYFFIEESTVQTGPLAALTRLLRSFTGRRLYIGSF